MKALFLCVLAAGCLACQQVPRQSVAQSPATATADSTRQLVLAMFDAFNRHDSTALAALYADRALLYNPGPTGLRADTGAAFVRAHYGEMFRLMPNIRDSVVSLVAEGNTAAVQFVSTGTGPDGKPFRLPIAAFLTVQNGRITHDITYYDRMLTGGE